MSESLGDIFIEVWLSVGEGVCLGKSLLHVKLSSNLCVKRLRLHFASFAVTTYSVAYSSSV